MALVNVLDYRDINGNVDVQLALDTAQDGDRVYLPGVQVSGQPYQTPPITPWRIQRSIEVFGDGPNNPGGSQGTTIVPGGTGDVFEIVPPGPPPSRIESVYLHDFQIKNGASATGSSGIHVKTAADKGIGMVRLERIAVLNLNQHAFFLEGTDGSTGAIDRLLMIDCSAFGCNELGMMLKHVLQAAIVKSGASTCLVGGAVLDHSGAAFYRSSFENNGVGPGNPGPPGPGTHPQVWFDTCHTAIMDAGHFEKFQNAPKKACIIQKSGGAAWLAASNFTIPAGDNTDVVGLEVPSSTEGGPVIAATNRFKRVDKLVDVAQGVVGAVVMPQFVDRVGATQPGQVLVPLTVAASGNDALLASPSIGRLGLPTRAFAGLIVPSLPTDPNESQRNGMLYYDAPNDRFRVLVAGVWKTVKVM